jgi:hypothetical protein
LEFLDHEYEMKPFGISKGTSRKPLGIERVEIGI